MVNSFFKLKKHLCWIADTWLILHRWILQLVVFHLNRWFATLGIYSETLAVFSRAFVHHLRVYLAILSEIRNVILIEKNTSETLV